MVLLESKGNSLIEENLDLLWVEIFPGQSLGLICLNVLPLREGGPDTSEMHILSRHWYRANTKPEAGPLGRLD